MSRKVETNVIFAGTDWSNMVVIRNDEGRSATTIQKHLLSFASKFGYKSLTDELTSGNWKQIYSEAITVNGIGDKEAGNKLKVDPINRRGLVTRAIIVKQDRILLYRWSHSKKRWIIAEKYTMYYTNIHEVRPAESKSEVESEPEVVEKPMKVRDTNTVQISHLVPADNVDLVTAVISTLVRNDKLPLFIDQDEHGNLCVESEAGRVLVAV